MSTSLLYHGWGLRGYRHQRTEFVEGRIVFHVTQDADAVCCPDCGGQRLMRQGVVSRTFKALPIGGKPVDVVLPVQRVRCHDCGPLRQVKVGFADERRRYTRGFARYALELSRHATLSAVAQHLGVSWDVIKDIQKQYLRTHFAKPRLRDLKQIAIDEISIGRHHHYLTVVLDLQSGAVVFVGAGKGAEALTPFWKRLRAAKALVEAVATDMSPAYLMAVHDHLPGAVHVLDRFHVIKLYNDKLAELRRRVWASTESIEHKRILKGTRWLLVKNAHNLDETRNERQRLEDALRINQPLATAYYMKEDLGRLWEQINKRHAGWFLDDWIGRAEASGVRMLVKFAHTLRLHRKSLLAWYDCPIGTSPLEGVNNKIKTMQRQAYGYRDQEFFRLKIFAIHRATYALVG